MSDAAQTPVRVLVVDQDPAVRRLLQAELGAAGYEVDTLSSGNGFTADMVALVAPDVLLVDPFIGDVPLPAVEELLTQLRTDLRLVLLLMDSGRDPRRVTAISDSCRADGILSKRTLLADPASAVEAQLSPEEPLEEELIQEVQPLPNANAAAERGQEIELDSQPLPPRPSLAPPSSPKPAVRRHASRPDLLAMIEEELGDRPVAPPPSQLVVVDVNLFSRHNFYVGRTGDLSSGGIFVATAMLPKIGTRVPIKLLVPFLPELITEAVVEWARAAGQLGKVTTGVGLSLAHLSEQERASLQRFFRERAPLTYLPDRK